MNVSEHDNGSSDQSYKQELSRSLGMLGAVGIALAGVGPAVSVFIVAPAGLMSIGSGTAPAFLLGAVIAIAMAFNWAELGAAFPVAGGDYGLVARAFPGRAKTVGSGAGFVTVGVLLIQIICGPALIALGASTYLAPIWSVNPKIIAVIVLVIVGILAVFNVRVGAWVAGVIFAIELCALTLLTVLGFSHWHNSPVSFFSHPQLSGAEGVLTSVGYGAVFAFTAATLFAFNGFNVPVFFSEELRGSSRNVARAVLLSLAVVVIAEFVPVIAVMVGAPSLSKLFSAPVPFEYFIKATSNGTVYTVVSVIIALAFMNCLLAGVLAYGRFLYGTARDLAWPGPVNRLLSMVSRRSHVPWAGTSIQVIVGIVMCLTVSTATLVTLMGASIVVGYTLVALAAFFGRALGATKRSKYRMPLWPLAPIVAIAALVYVYMQQSATALRVTGITVAVAFVYWAVYLLSRRGRAWVMKAPITTDAEIEEPTTAAPDVLLSGVQVEDTQ